MLKPGENESFSPTSRPLPLKIIHLDTTVPLRFQSELGTHSLCRPLGKPRVPQSLLAPAFR
jgi:hypothetical protein